MQVSRFPVFGPSGVGFIGRLAIQFTGSDCQFTPLVVMFRLMNDMELLFARAESKCELCSSVSDLAVYEVPHPGAPAEQSMALLCSVCRTQIEDSSQLNSTHWSCLSQSMWTQVPAVQVLVWRILDHYSAESWAKELLDQLYLEESILEWAKSGPIKADSADDDDSAPTLDSNGSPLVDGDSVTLIKDLDVKGANFTAKRGTLVRNISLTGDPALVEGRINGSTIVLKTCFLKKAGG